MPDTSPEGNRPFYRVTVFSHYFPNNVPDIQRFSSLMAEVSESRENRQPSSRGRGHDRWHGCDEARHQSEVSNQDHSFAQGVEAADRFLDGGEEETVNHPEVVNTRKR
jgi:hypothetical protein